MGLSVRRWTERQCLTTFIIIRADSAATWCVYARVRVYLWLAASLSYVSHKHARTHANCVARGSERVSAWIIFYKNIDSYSCIENNQPGSQPKLPLAQHYYGRVSFVLALSLCLSLRVLITSRVIRSTWFQMFRFYFCHKPQPPINTHHKLTASKARSIRLPNSMRITQS